MFLIYRSNTSNLPCLSMTWFAGITAALGALIADEPDEPTGDSLLGNLH